MLSAVINFVAALFDLAVRAVDAVLGGALNLLFGGQDDIPQ